jgi:hypothetical protein
MGPTILSSQPHKRPPTWISVGAVFLFLIGMIVTGYGMQNAALLSIGKQTDARITRVYQDQTINSAGVHAYSTYATLVTATNTPIKGSLLVSGDHKHAGERVNVYYDPSGKIGPQFSNDVHKPTGEYIFGLITLAICLWPISASLAMTRRLAK